MKSEMMQQDVGIRALLRQFLHPTQPSVNTFPWPPASGSVTILRGQRVAPEVKTALLALTPRIIRAPVRSMRPIEQYKRIIVVSVVPVRQKEDPIIPIPLANLPDRFWNLYAKYWKQLDGFLLYGDGIRVSRSKTCHRLIERMLRIAKVLYQDELAYLNMQLRAAMAGGEVARR